ncbi:808_t:CDS:2 [Entrophospora sp. SA101]|nr:808_t:CDS:2 [Entrophospora sp. SA101]CAJ0836485.1 5266_t:CDS:2 [Entrophospora sp. SA101]
MSHELDVGGGDDEADDETNKDDDETEDEDDDVTEEDEYEADDETEEDEYEADDETDEDDEPRRRLDRELELSMAAFDRLVREEAGPGVRFQSGAIRELQRRTERGLMKLFRDASLCAEYAGKSEVGLEDLRFAAEFRERKFGYFHISYTKIIIAEEEIRQRAGVEHGSV